MFSRRQFLIGCSALAAGGLLRSRPALAADELVARRLDLYASYSERLAELAAWCDEQHLEAQGDFVRNWLPDRLPDREYLFVPADFRHGPAIDSDDESPEHPDKALLAEFEKRFTAFRVEQSKLLLALADRAAAAGRTSLACQLASEAAREDLDCQRAWRFLGYTRYAGSWRTRYEIAQLKAGNVFHKRFGWLPRADAARYDRGERLFRGRWMSDREEAQRRASIRDGWRVETDHYVVTSDQGLEEAVALAGQLERLWAVWRQVFAGYLVEPAALARALSAGEPMIGRSGGKHAVMLYRNRAEYNSALRGAQPEIEMTLGIYFANQRTAFFFAGLGQEPGTLEHEATHQLFEECRPVAKGTGERDNFWILEGVACYMESLVAAEGYYTLGGPDAGRMPAARRRRLRNGYYVPLAELVRLGKRDFQRRDDLARLYSESAGLATFLVDRYPQQTAEYLRAVYAGSSDSDTLARLTGVTYPELDAAYGDYLAQLER